MPHTSALIASSLSWDNSSIAALRPRTARARVEQESFAWQQMSQDGSAAEEYAMPTALNRRHIVNGRVTLVPKRPRRIAPPNRLLELHGLAGAIGEQLGLAWTAEQDVQRFIATSAGRLTEHQRLVQRALAETAAYFLLGASHSLANMVLRIVILNPDALKLLSARRPRANGYPVFSDEHGAWVSLNREEVRDIRAAANVTNNRFMISAVDHIAALRKSTGFVDLEARRGMDYHRRRPQSVPHSSPRREAVMRIGNMTQFTGFAEQLEPEADADKLHALVVQAIEALRTAMRDVRRTMPKAIRAEGITYVHR
jgi:hypothetical protein